MTQTASFLALLSLLPTSIEEPPSSLHAWHALGTIAQLVEDYYWWNGKFPPDMARLRVSFDRWGVNAPDRRLSFRWRLEPAKSGNPPELLVIAEYRKKRIAIEGFEWEGHRQGGVWRPHYEINRSTGQEQLARTDRNIADYIAESLLILGHEGTTVRTMSELLRGEFGYWLRSSDAKRYSFAWRGDKKGRKSIVIRSNSTGRSYTYPSRFPKEKTVPVVRPSD